jgi:hypothetical protein
VFQDSNRIQHYFSFEKQPTLWRALPALEELQTAWETKRESAQYELYGDALDDSLAKIGKYYSHLDEKPAFVLALGKSFFLISHCLYLSSQSTSSVLQIGVHQSCVGWS